MDEVRKEGLGKGERKLVCKMKKKILKKKEKISLKFYKYIYTQTYVYIGCASKINSLQVAYL